MNGSVTTLKVADRGKFPCRGRHPRISTCATRQPAHNVPGLDVTYGSRARALAGASEVVLPSDLCPPAERRAGRGAVRAPGPAPRAEPGAPAGRLVAVVPADEDRWPRTPARRTGGGRSPSGPPPTGRAHGYPTVSNPLCVRLGGWSPCSVLSAWSLLDLLELSRGRRRSDQQSRGAMVCPGLLFRREVGITPSR